MTAWVGAACLQHRVVMCQKVQFERLHAVRKVLKKMKRQIALSSDHGGQLGARRLLCMDKVQVCYHLQNDLMKQQCMHFQKHDSNVQDVGNAQGTSCSAPYAEFDSGM